MNNSDPKKQTLDRIELLAERSKISSEELAEQLHKQSEQIQHIQKRSYNIQNQSRKTGKLIKKVGSFWYYLKDRWFGTEREEVEPNQQSWEKQQEGIPNMAGTQPQQENGNQVDKQLDRIKNRVKTSKQIQSKIGIQLAKEIKSLEKVQTQTQASLKRILENTSKLKNI